MKTNLKSGLDYSDMLLLWITLILWLAVFLTGTLVNSEPYRNRFAAFEGGFFETLKSGLLVMITYTLTNVAFLCILAGVLGVLGTKAILVSEKQKNDNSNKDTTSPKNSAVLRGFLVYLTLIAGVLILGDDPAKPTQIQYVRLAGLMSLTGFVVNYRPDIFGKLLQRAGNLITESTTRQPGQGGSDTNTIPPA